MEESVMLRPFIIAVATVAALGISFSSTDASAAGPGGRGSHGGGGGGGAAVPSGGGGMGGGGMGRSGMGGGGTFGGSHPSFSASPSARRGPVSAAPMARQSTMFGSNRGSVAGANRRHGLHGHRRGGWYGGWGDGDWGSGFYDYPDSYYGPDYYGCYRTIRVATRHGPRWRRVWVCD